MHSAPPGGARSAECRATARGHAHVNNFVIFDTYLASPTSPALRAWTLRALAELITVSGVGRTAVVTHVGTAYARVRVFDGGNTRGIAVRFDATVVPSLQAAGAVLV